MKYANKHCTCHECFENGRHVYIYSGEFLDSGEEHQVEIPANELYAYRDGEYIQDALKSVSVDDREFLMSGMSPKFFDQFDD